MTLLIIETSKQEGFAALAHAGKVLLCHTVSSKEFLPVASSLFEPHQQSIDAIAVGIGPGSYTGTRSGVAFAKTLAFAKNIPLLGFYSPLAYLPEGEGAFAYTIDAKRGEFSLITGEKTHDAIINYTAPVRLTHTELEATLSLIPLQAQNDSSTLNLLPLITTLQHRLTSHDYDPGGEVSVAYLYDIPLPTV